MATLCATPGHDGAWIALIETADIPRLIDAPSSVTRGLGVDLGINPGRDVPIHAIYPVIGDDGLGWNAALLGVQRLSFLTIQAQQGKVEVKPTLAPGKVP